MNVQVHCATVAKNVQCATVAKNVQHASGPWQVTVRAVAKNVQCLVHDTEDNDVQLLLVRFSIFLYLSLIHI